MGELGAARDARPSSPAHIARRESDIAQQPSSTTSVTPSVDESSAYKSQYWYYSYGDTNSLQLMMALAARDGLVRWEVVSQRALIIVCTSSEWLALLYELKHGNKPAEAPAYMDVVIEVGDYKLEFKANVKIADGKAILTPTSLPMWNHGIDPGGQWQGIADSNLYDTQTWLEPEDDEES